MIFSDTSVWVDYFRGRPKALVGLVNQLLDDDQLVLAAPVKLEILSGCSKSNLPPLRRVLSALPVFYPSSATWPLIEKWIGAGIAHDQRFGFSDLLIAAIGSENRGLVWSLDKDFLRMERLGFIKTYSPK